MKIYHLENILMWLDYHFQKIDIKRTESYIVSPDWIASKKATINP